jgi:hypothetical protein
LAENVNKGCNMPTHLGFASMRQDGVGSWPDVGPPLLPP